MTIKESYEEYLEFVESDELINGFVHFETISSFGEFISFTTGGRSTSDFGEYWYRVKDDKGVELRLEIEHFKREQVSTTDNILDVDTTDLRQLNSNITGIYENNGIYYHYSNGILRRISWEKSETRFILHGVENYPLFSGEQTVVASLLNTQTASDTLNNMFESSAE